MRSTTVAHCLPRAGDIFHRALSPPQQDPVIKKNRAAPLRTFSSNFTAVAADERGEDRVVNRRKGYENILENQIHSS